MTLHDSLKWKIVVGCGIALALSSLSEAVTVHNNPINYLTMPIVGFACGAGLSAIVVYGIPLVKTWQQWRLIATLAAAPIALIVAMNGSKLNGVAFIQEVLPVVAGLPALAWFGITRLMTRKGEETIILTRDKGGLPVFEWEDDWRSGGHIDVKYRTKRRCRIGFDEEGGAHFVHETSDYNKAARPLLAVGLLGGIDGRMLAEKFIKKEKIGLTETTQAGPWTALQSFLVTDENKYLGSRTYGGDPVRNPDAVIVADFGTEWGQFVVSCGKMPQIKAGALRDKLTHEFIERRPEHLQRLKSATRAAQHESAGPRKKVV